MMVGFGNIWPEARETTHGREERGEKGKAFDPRTGKGYVSKKKGQYTKALEYKMDVRTLLFSTFGGFSPEVIELLKQAAEERGERLRGDEYDDTTWSARSWTVYASQRISCALMRAVAFELSHALALTSARDPRE